MNNFSSAGLDRSLDAFSAALDELTAAIGGRDIARIETALSAHDAALHALDASTVDGGGYPREQLLKLQARLEDAGRLARIAERLTERRLSALVGERPTDSYTASGSPSGTAASKLRLNA